MHGGTGTPSTAPSPREYDCAWRGRVSRRVRHGKHTARTDRQRVRQDVQEAPVLFCPVRVRQLCAGAVPELLLVVVLSAALTAQRGVSADCRVEQPARRRRRAQAPPTTRHARAAGGQDAVEAAAGAAAHRLISFGGCGAALRRAMHACVSSMSAPSVRRRGSSLSFVSARRAGASAHSAQRQRSAAQRSARRLCRSARRRHTYL